MCVFQNPKRQKANHLAIYKHGGTVELRTVERQIQTTVKACLEPGTSALRVLCTHPATLSLLANFITSSTDKKSNTNFIFLLKSKCFIQSLPHRDSGKNSNSKSLDHGRSSGLLQLKQI